MRCLHCGKRLSLLRKVGGSGFCSEAHRRAYLEEQETLGLARLIESKQQPENRAKQRKPVSRPKRAGSDAPAFFDKFLPQPLRARSVIVPYQQPGPPIMPTMMLVAPQQEVQLGFCRLPRATVEEPRSVAKSGVYAAQISQAEETAMVVALSLPVSKAQPLREQGEEVPEIAGAVPMELAIPVSEAMPATTPASVIPPSHMIVDPILHVRLNQSLPAGGAAAQPVTSPVTDYPEVRPFPSGEPVSPTRLPLWTTAPKVDADLQELLAAYERDSRGGFLSFLRAVAPRDCLRHISADLSLPNEPACVLPTLVRQWPVGLHTAEGVSAGFQQLLAEAPSVNPSILPGDVVTRMPALVPQSALLGLRRQGAVAVPTVFCEGPRQAHTEPPLAVPCSAFMLPPPDVRLASPCPSGSLKLARVPMSAAFSAERAVKPDRIATPLGLQSVDPRMPEAMAVPAATVLEASSGPARETREPRSSAGEPLHAPSPEPPRVEGPQLPLAEEPGLPAGLHVASEAAHGMQAEREHSTSLAGTPSYRSHDASESAQPVVVPRVSAEDSDAVQKPLAAAARRRPGLVSIGLGALVPTDSANHHLTSLKVRSMAPEPMVPEARLQTIPELVADASNDPRQGPPLWKRAWGPVVARSQAVRKGLIWTSLAAALVLAFQFYTPPKVSIASETGTETHAGFRTELAGHWASFQADIANRAAVNLMDDFRSGLGNWTGNDGWSETWSYDDAGYVRPGQLALYRPTIYMDDYQLSFAGQIEENGLSWAVRAADSENYYAIRLVVSEPGPIPRVNIVRFPVVDGRRGQATTSPLPFPIRNGQTHEIGTSVNGDDFTLYVNGRVVDYWSEPRLSTGGVGFLRTSGETSRLRWVSVTHQYDLLGRLCALLVPYNFENASRSIER